MSDGPAIPILLYHKIGAPPRGARLPGQYVSPALFRRHLDYLQRHGYRAISLLDIVRQDRDLPRRPVVITFDDGYQCLHRHAFPALAERSWTATIFLVAEALGGTSVWERAAGGAAEPLLGIPEIREMRGAGLEFGSHSLTHPRLTALTDAEAAQEISASRSRLGEALGEPCRSFAYPYGDWDHRVRDLVASAGYEVACTTVRLAARREDDPFSLPRVNIRRYNLVPRFGYKLWRAQRARA